MSILASVLLLLQLSTSLLANAASNPNITDEQRQAATTFANTAMQVALQYLAENPVTTTTIVQSYTPVVHAPVSNPTSTPTSTENQPATFGGVVTSTGPMRVNIYDLDSHFSYHSSVSDYSVNTPSPQGGVTSELNGNKNILFSTTANQLQVEITLNGETKNAEFQNIPKGVYNFVIKVSKGNQYGTLSGTINANTNCDTNPSCNITNTVFSTPE